MARTSPPEIETPRLRLREFRATDIDDYAACLGDAEVMKYIGDGLPLSREDAWRSMAVMAGHWSLRGYGHWAVEEKATRRLVGRVGYYFPEGWPSEEIGWLLARGVWGRGYAFEAAGAALARGRALLGLERVISVIQPENAASIRLAKRLGATLDRRIVLKGKEADIYSMPLPPSAPADAAAGDRDPGAFASRLVGTWLLRSRIDTARDGSRRVDPHLGADPLGILVYDRAGNFAAQFMKRDRSEAAAAAIAASPSAAAVSTALTSNNSRAVGGYDAYFGTYRVDEATGDVTQTLRGSLSPGDVGRVLTRRLDVRGDRLDIELETTTPDGEPVVRVLSWERAI
ncbi:MAG TPA: GNAT family N-acetyltransferase [Candidatus Eisenbacteria bacterium]|nr:GNAT family N-acetyltransferase [Candidatus Eisenbacteria bacterium]